MQERLEFFNFLNRQYEKIYVVTIARATERHLVLKQELNGLNFELFFGADFQNLNFEDLKSSGIFDEEKSKANHRYSKPLKGGMLGCSLSHRMVYEDILKNGFKKVLILEDDVLIQQFSFADFKLAISELPPDWDLLYFDYHKNEKRPILGWVKQFAYHIQSMLGGLNYTHRAIKNMYAKPFSNHLLNAGLHDFTNAYAITLNCAEILLKLQTPVQWFPDQLAAFASTNKLIKAYCLKEKPFYQTSQTTNPEQSLLNDNSY